VVTISNGFSSYSRPRFTAESQGYSDDRPHKGKLREHFNSNIVEFWSAAWYVVFDVLVIK